MVLGGTERLTGSAGERRSLVGGLRVAPADAETAAPSESAGQPGARIAVPGLYVPAEQAEHELAPKRRRRRTARLT